MSHNNTANSKLDWWAEVEKDDENNSGDEGRDEMGLDLDDLPPFERIQRDGFVYEISFERRADGKVVRKFRKFKQERKRKRVSKAALERRKIPKFGACAGQERGHLERGKTIQNVEEATLDWTFKQEETEQPARKAMGQGDYVEINMPERREEQKEEEEKTIAKKITGGRRARDSARLAQRETYELRVTNVPFETESRHMYALIESINGRRHRNDEKRQYVKQYIDSRNRYEGEEEKHFFLSFGYCQDAVNVLSVLNGYKYGGMIMSVEWSQKSKTPEPNMKPKAPLSDRRSGFGNPRRAFRDRPSRGGFGGDRDAGRGGSTLSSRRTGFGRGATLRR